MMKAATKLSDESSSHATLRVVCGDVCVIQLEARGQGQYGMAESLC